MGAKIEIISFKHNGDLHRIWQYATIVRASDNECVLVNDHANVIDGDGRRWKTKEPAVCYFYKDYWFNAICMLRNGSIYYYCNLSSPYVIDEEGLKYIDYELDVKLFPSGNKLILDRDEFEFNQIDYHYPQELVSIIEYQLKNLLKMIDNKEGPFDAKNVLKDYELYLSSRKARKDYSK